MSDTNPATKNDLDQLEERLDGRFVALEERLDKKIGDAVSGAVKEMAELFSDGLQMIAGRFDQVDERFDRVEERLDRLESNSKDMQVLLIRIDDRTHDDAEVTRRHTREIRALQRKVA
jgi:tetrahydromethanopterin S-methyltransferase subunit G